MPNTLLLRLPAPDQTDVDWLTIDEAAQLPALRQRGPLALAAAAARSARAIALAPATQILLAEPELPPGSGAKLARAVPFALEEQLTEDVDHLSFALGRRRAGGGTPVAVVSRAVLQGWVDALEGAGIEPKAIYPDIALIPENPGQTVLWLEDARLAVRRPGALPFVVELEPVTEALVVAGVIADPQDEAAAPRVPESVLLHATREDWARVQDEFETLLDRFASIKVQLLPEGPLPWLARGLSDPDAVNLLQGDFARNADRNAALRRWRAPAAHAARLLPAPGAAPTLQIRQADRESARLDGEIAKVFAQALPSDKPQNPRRQMQSRLDQIRRATSGPQHFLHALEAVSAAAAAPPPVNIHSLSYREQSLELRMSAPNLVALSQFAQQVGQHGLNADIQSSTPAGEGVEAHLQIRAPGAKVRR